METCSCKICGEQFEVSCASELDKKLRKHKCPNKRKLRTLALQQQLVDNFTKEVTVDRIHDHNFDKLVRQGMIV